jgi:hypothetical protein
MNRKTAQVDGFVTDIIGLLIDDIGFRLELGVIPSIPSKWAKKKTGW